MIETVGAGAASATVLESIAAINLVAGDILVWTGNVRCQSPAALGTPPYSWLLYLYDNTAGAALGALAAAGMGCPQFDYTTNNVSEYFTLNLHYHMTVSVAQAAAGLDVRIWNGSANSIELESPAYLGYIKLPYRF